MKELKVYGFNSESGEYTGEQVAFESPVEPGVYLLPANTTGFEPPKFKKNKVRVWDGQKWEYADGPKKAASKIPAQPQTAEEKAAVLRYIRNKKLAVTDWTQLKDVPEATSQAWATYRQDLRDLTAQENFPENVTWPEEPVV